MRSFKKRLLQKKNRTQTKRAQVNDMVGKRYEVNDMVISIYHIKIFETIPARITTHFKRVACSRGKTNKYFYHKRK